MRAVESRATGKKDHQEEGNVERKELPAEIRPENVKAIRKSGMLELTMPKAAVVKKVKIEVKPLCGANRPQEVVV